MKGIMTLIQEKKTFQYLENRINNVSADLERLSCQLDEFIEKIKIIEPDNIDVHNINRRIDILTQKIATLESNKKGWLR